MARKPVILIVDDEEDVVSPLAHRFLSVGYDVRMEPNGQLGLQTALDAKPDLVLLDVMMPGIDGFETLRRLRANPAVNAVPVIMLTTKSLMRDAEHAFAEGADDYVSKPYRWELLLPKVQRLLSRK